VVLEEQTSPLQHTLFEQSWSWPEQAPPLDAVQEPSAPQLIPPQQSPSWEQVELLHPHEPFTQRPEQHVSGPSQPRPSCWQPPPGPDTASLDEPGTQPPLSQVRPPQQSVGAVHEPPFCEHPQ